MKRMAAHHLLAWAIVIYGAPLAATPFARINGTGVVYTTLQAAITAAAPGNRVHCSANVGAYNETVVIDKNLMLDGGYDLACTNKLDGYCTQINGGLTPGAPLITIVSQVFVYIRDFELYNGWNNVSPGGGGGLCAKHSSRVVAERCMIANNSAVNGGGIFAFDGVIIVLSNCHVHHNDAADGGGMYLHSSTGTCVGGCAFEDNTAGNSGGGMFVAYSVLTLTGGVRYAGNHAPLGGALHCWRSDVLAAGPDVSMGGIGAGDAPNTADNGAGIAIWDADVTLNNGARVMNNSALYNGGGIWMTNGTLVLYNDVLIGADVAGGTNYAGGYGGGICVIGGKLVVSNQTRIQHNCAVGAGGGVYGVNARMLMRDCIVGHATTNFANRAGIGGGMYAAGCSSVLTTVTLACNEADQAGGLDARGGGSCFVNDSVIIGNRAQTYGGVRLDGLTIKSVFDQTDILSNRATTANGGIFSATPLLLQNHTRVMGNVAPETAGLGVYACTVTLDQVEIAYNQAANGGAGIDVFDGMADCTDVAIQWNNADSDGDHAGDGGGVRADNSTVILRAVQQDCLLLGNSAAQGGGVYAAWGSNVRFDAASNRQYTVTGNGGLQGNGGGVGLVQGSSLRAYGNIVFSGNGAVNGGAACITSGGTIELGVSNGVAPRLLNNYATLDGGGICAFGAGSTVQLNQVLIGAPGLGNRAQRGPVERGGGGGAALYDGAVLDAVNVQWLHNVSHMHGGAIYADNARLNVRGDGSAANCAFWPGCVFAGNINTSVISATGMVHVRGSAARLDMLNTLIISNVSTWCNGVAIAEYARGQIVNTVIARNHTSSYIPLGVYATGTGAATLVHCTIADNGTYGVYINRGGVCALTNCIVWGHSFFEIDVLAAADHCCIEGGFGPGTHIISSDPRFADTNALNYQIVWGSPCVNTGILVGVGVDCIGVARPYGSGVDLGAYECVPEPGGWGMLGICTIYNLQFTVLRRRREE